MFLNQSLLSSKDCLHFCDLEDVIDTKLICRIILTEVFAAFALSIIKD